MQIVAVAVPLEDGTAEMIDAYDIRLYKYMLKLSCGIATTEAIIDHISYGYAVTDSNARLIFAVLRNEGFFA